MRESVRKEFHQAERVTSTEEITRLLAVGRGCLLRYVSASISSLQSRSQSYISLQVTHCNSPPNSVEDQLVSKDVVTDEERTLAQHARDGTEPSPVAPDAEGDADLNSFVIKDDRT